MESLPLPLQEFDVEKHWWGWRAASLGFQILYMDSDVVAMRNPLLPFEKDYDVQGLTDWQDLERPELALGTTLDTPCQLYLHKPDARLPSKVTWTERWNVKEGQEAVLMPNPCQSTGIWYLKPTPAVVAFMRAVVDRIGYHILDAWDQTAWNEIILHFLWGAGDQGEPLRYRLLPFSEFSNIGKRRRRAGGRGGCGR